MDEVTSCAVKALHHAEQLGAFVVVAAKDSRHSVRQLERQLIFRAEQSFERCGRVEYSVLALPNISLIDRCESTKCKVDMRRHRSALFENRDLVVQSPHSGHVGCAELVKPSERIQTWRGVRPKAAATGIERDVL